MPTLIGTPRTPPSFLVEEPFALYNRSELSVDEMTVADSIQGQSDVLSLDVSVMVRLIALFCVLGWLFFVVFAGVGVIGLPYKLI